MKEKAITQQAPAPLGWGDNAQIKEMVDRLRRFLPGAKTMNDDEITAYAQYVVLTGLNPFREVYGWDSKGNGTGELVTKEHYALLVRWARSKENFAVRYQPIEANKGDTAYKCRLLRDSSRPVLQQLLMNEVSYQEAMEWATTEGLGIVRASEKARKGPPKGKDWDWVAKKRALEDALREAFGMPTTQELACQSWIVEGVATLPEDWNGVTVDMIPAEREALALANAHEREREPIQETSRESMAILGFDEEPTGMETQEPESVEGTDKAPPESPEGSTEAPGNGNRTSPWYKRNALIFRVVSEIGYFENAPHVINTLKMLESENKIAWKNDDEAIVSTLNLYARRKADEKAAEQGNRRR